MISKVMVARFVIFTTGASILHMFIHRTLSTKQQQDLNTKQIINLISPDLKHTEITRKSNKLQQKIKYLLLWTSALFQPFKTLGKGQRKFIENKCPWYNCFVTSNRRYFGNNLSKFDAIGFNARNMLSPINLPSNRASHQLYIFFSTESSENYPICLDLYDGFFNLTSTYKLDSDIPWNYFNVFDKQGHIVAPKVDTKWVDQYTNTNNMLEEKFKKKTKLGAWFVSNCKSKSKPRKKYVKELQKALQVYGSKIDIYGTCGTLRCPKENEDYCNKMLEDDYFFYLAFENSIAKDYLTEKVVKSLNKYVVPVVLGGANYSRFLPPGSYIDALEYTPAELANLMIVLSHSFNMYNQYFRWKNHFIVRMAPPRVCEVCAALNNVTLVKERRVYRDFRSWWHPSFMERCGLD